MATMHSRMLARAKGVMVLRKRRLLSGLDILMDQLGKISSVAPRFATAANTIGDLRNELARADTDSNGIQLTMNQIGQYVSKLEPICSNFVSYSIFVLLDLAVRMTVARPCARPIAGARRSADLGNSCIFLARLKLPRALRMS